MAEKWQQAPGGGVKLTIYTDGTLGGEDEMVRRMGINSIQAGLLSGAGLAQIDPSVTALQTMPMVYDTLEEVDYVREKLRPKLEKQMADKGYIVLFWVNGGWVKLFSREPVVMPDDLRKQKLFTWSGDSKSGEIVKNIGFQPVPLETTDILTSLRTGLIDAVPIPAFYALAGQFYDTAPNMLDMAWSPLAGAMVVRKSAWDQIPPETQKILRAAANQAGLEMSAHACKEMNDAVVAMQKRGLHVNKLTPAAVIAWKQVAESTYPQIRGNLVPADMFDEVQALLKDYRAAKKP
jgi:TRAP-type transport system periplasmic protein